MSYHLRADESVEAGLRRLASDQIDRALGEVDDRSLDLHRTVHQVRKRCKKLRALLRLMRPSLSDDTYPRENMALRDAQRRLSSLRDAQARIDTFDALLSAFEGEVEHDAFGQVRAALEAGRDLSIAEQESGLAESLTGFREALCGARTRSEKWELKEDGFDAVRGGLLRTYRRGRRSMTDAYAEGSGEAFHEWRKRVKYHLYHVRLLRELWKPALKVRRQALDRLADLLGEEHDLAVLRRYLRDHPLERLEVSRDEALRGLIAARRSHLRRQAYPLGRRLFADGPKALSRRFGSWFEVAADEATADGAERLSAPSAAPR